MCMYFVISNKSLKEWTWRVVNDAGESIARSAQYFPTRHECIDDAENFSEHIADAAFYDSAGVPIDPMHLKRGVFPPRKPTIKIKFES